MAERWQFGAYLYPDSIIEGCSREGAQTKLRTAETPGAVGRYTQGGIPGARRLTLRGHLNPVASLEPAWDQFASAHAPGRVAALFVGRDDRYLLAEVVGVKDISGDDFPISIPWEVSFEGSYPFFVAATETTATLGNTGGNITVTGTADTSPVISVPVIAVNAAGLITISAATDGLSTGQIVIKCPPATTTISIDTAQRKLTNSAGQNVTALVIGGSFPSLRGATAVLTAGASGGAAIGAVGVSFRNCWY